MMGAHRLSSGNLYPMTSYFELDEYDLPRSRRTYHQYTTPYTQIPFCNSYGQLSRTIRQGDIIWILKSRLDDPLNQEVEEKGEGSVKAPTEEELREQRDIIDTHSAHTLLRSDDDLEAEQEALIASYSASAPTSPTTLTRIPTPSRKTNVAPPSTPSTAQTSSTGPQRVAGRSIVRRAAPPRSRSCPIHTMPSPIRPRAAPQIRFDVFDDVHFYDKEMGAEEKMSLEEYFADWSEKDKKEILGGLTDGSLEDSGASETESEEEIPLGDTSDASKITSDVLEANKGAEEGPKIGVIVPVG